MNEMDIFNKIIERTDSTLLIFFILIIIAFVIIFIPLYKLMIKDRAKKNEAEAIQYDKIIKRESQLLEIITKNAEVISELKTLLSACEKNFSMFSNNLNDDILFLNEKIDRILTITTLLESNLKSNKQK